MIESNRLFISFATLKDIDDMYEYVSNKEVMKYERENYPTKQSYAKTLTILIEHNLMYSIRIKNETKVIGHIFLGKTSPAINNEYNIGYIINPLYQNNGYCSEASRAVVDYGFDILKANRIKAGCNPLNIPSWKVMEKIGLKKEGYYKKSFFIRNDDQGNPIYTDQVIYGLNITDWTKDKNTIISSQ